MLVFIDESGDTGFKFEKGSSEFFVVGIVVFNENEEAEKCDFAINNLRKNLKKGNYEFHYKSNSDAVKELFLKEVSRYNFYYYGFVLDKKKVYIQFKNKDEFYREVIGFVFENIKDKLDNSKITIDKTGNEEFGKSLAKYLKNKLNNGNLKRIRKVSMEESNKNNLLQLADYIASGINKKFSKNSKKDFLKILNTKEIKIELWPKN